jgi:hypothetical protein
MGCKERNRVDRGEGSGLAAQQSPYGMRNGARRGENGKATPNKPNRVAAQGRAAQPPPAALTVQQFCFAHAISRSLFYVLLKRGDGPRLLKAGRRTLVTADAAADWRHRMEAATAGEAA